MPIGEFPILEVIIRQLAQHGFDHVTLAVNHQAEIIKAFFQNGEKWDINIDYSLEKKPLSTMAPLRIISDLPDSFLVMNGDILTDLNFSDFYEEHLNSRKIFTISSYMREQKIDYGVLEVNSYGNLSAFKEKPSSQHIVSMGIYMVNRSIMNYIPNEKSYGFDNLMLDLLESKQSVGVRNFSGYWLDIGRPDDYMQAIEEFEKLKSTFLCE